MAQQTTDGSDAERAARLRNIQMEALGTLRRDFLTTHDAPDRFSRSIAPFNVEHHRRVNQTGTGESAVTDEHRGMLTDWNSAWQKLQNDDALEEGLEDLNAGQTHRARLLATVPESSGAASGLPQNGRGGSHPRGISRGGRGGGVAGSQPARMARRRVPIGDEDPLPARRTTAPKAIPSSSSTRPDARKLQVKLPSTLASTRPAATSTGSRLRIQTGNVQLVQADQFMSRVFGSANSVQPTPIVIAPQRPSSIQPARVSASSQVEDAKQKIPGQIRQVPTAARDIQASNTVPLPLGPRPAVRQSALLDPESTPAPTVRHSYTDDLLDMDIKESTSLPAPMPLNASIKKSHSQSFQAPPQPYATFLPLLKHAYPAQVAAQFESENVHLQRQINRTAGRLPQQVRGTSQQSKGFGSEPVHKDQEEVDIPIRGIASKVRQRTLAWGKDLITGTASSNNPILGENISRWRFNRHRRASAESLTALTERIDQLQLNESRSAVTSEAPSTQETYATINPFGPQPTADTLNTNADRRAPAPQLPQFLLSAARAEDPAAALMAEFNANFSNQAAEARIRSTVNPSSAVNAATQPVPERSSKRPLPERSTIEENNSRSSDAIGSANYPDFSEHSSTSASFLRRSPALGETTKRPYSRRESSSSPRPTLGLGEGTSLARDTSMNSHSAAPPQHQGPPRRPSDLSGSGQGISDDLPRFHPRLGNNTPIPTPAPTSQQQDPPRQPSDLAGSGQGISSDLPRFHPRLGGKPPIPTPAPTNRQTYFPTTNRAPRLPSGPTLPSFLANIQPPTDPGLAAAEQDGGAPQSPSHQGQERPNKQ